GRQAASSPAHYPSGSRRHLCPSPFSCPWRLELCSDTGLLYKQLALTPSKRCEMIKVGRRCWQERPRLLLGFALAIVSGLAWPRIALAQQPPANLPTRSLQRCSRTHSCSTFGFPGRQIAFFKPIRLFILPTAD